jgi:7tm Chemosensory receptor
MKTAKRRLFVACSFAGLIFPMTFVVYYLDCKLIKVPLLIYSSSLFCFCLGNAAGYTSAIKIRVKSLNGILERRARKDEFILKVKQLKDHDNADDVGNLSEIYQKLMDGVEAINVCFSIQLMLGFGMIFFYSLFTGFTAYVDFFTQQNISAPALTSIMFSVYYNFFLFVVLLSCCLLEKEVRRCSRDYRVKLFDYRRAELLDS